MAAAAGSPVSAVTEGVAPERDGMFGEPIAMERI